MSSDRTDLTEQGRAFVQQRVALFGQVMFVICLLGLVLQVTLTPSGQLWRPWFGFFLGQTGLMAAAWLLCRRGQRPVWLIHAVEATALIGGAVLIAVMGRLMLPGHLPAWLEGEVLPADAAYGRLVGAIQVSHAFSIMIGLGLSAFARAALVPSRASRTAVLTGLMAVPMIVVAAVPVVPFEGEPPLRMVVPDKLVTVTVVNIGIWWSFITIVCSLVSKIIFGLRQQVRQARRLGQYTLETKLGEGGMGAVYGASHAMMRRPTAIKLMRPDQAGETNLARFEREVQLTARLTHPNTVTIYDYGRTPDGVFYYAMELLDGATLEQIVSEDGPQPAGRVLKVLVEVASALEEAHGIGLIHRDIKPSNVILCTQGGKQDVAKLLDFGLVKELAGEPEVALTKESSLTGTPQYMCPESLTSPDAVDARSDLYALGAVGYFGLTGSHVFDGKTLVEVCGHHMHSEPEPPSRRLGGPVPSDLEKLLLSCLAKDPGDRPQSAAELREALEACEDMGEWTQEKAERWWRTFSQALRATRGVGDRVSETKTIAVDLARHRAP